MVEINATKIVVCTAWRVGLKMTIALWFKKSQDLYVHGKHYAGVLVKFFVLSAM